MGMSLKQITSIAAAVTALAAAGAVLGVDSLPRPAWASELSKLAGAVVELDSRVTSQQLDDAKLSFFQNMRDQREFPNDDDLLQERVLIERKIDDLEDRLQSLRQEGD